MIDHITEFENRKRTESQVHYKIGRVRRFEKNDNLPNTVLNLYLNGNAETKYTETGKITYIR